MKRPDRRGRNGFAKTLSVPKAKLEVTVGCSACGNAFPLGAKFCGVCGNKLIHTNGSKPRTSSLAKLGVDADAGDEAAMHRLISRARNKKLDPDGYPTWSELALALRS